MKIFLVTITALFPTLVFACLHYPKDYQGTVTEHKQEYFIYSTKDNFHLVAKTNLSSQGELPARLAWIFPLPSVPIKYEEVAPAVFNELHQLTLPLTNGMRDSLEAIPFSRSKGIPQGLVVHEAVTVGRYKIRPLEIIDPNPKTANELDTWLKENGLKEMPREKQLQYLKKGAVFLVIEADLQGLKAADFKPLHITLKPLTEYALPLNFTHTGRSFDVDVYSLGSEMSAVTGGLHRASSGKLSGAGGGYPELAKIIKTTPGSIQKYTGYYDGKGPSARDPIFTDSKVSTAEVIKSSRRR